jgi:Kef-type K+ transport system membrane component KefB
MTVILIILAGAALAFGLARWRGLPVVPMLILAGIGIAGLDLVTEPELFQDALLLGLAFLAFSFGTEMNPGRVGKQGVPAIRIGLIQFAVLALMGFGLGWLIMGEWLTAAYVGLGLAASSTLVVIRLLQNRSRLFEPFGRLVVGVLLVQDLLIILLIAGLAHIDDGLSAMLISVNGTLGLMLVAYVSQRWVTPWLLLRSNLDEEEQLLVVLAILFLFVGAATVIDVPIVVGAFLAGFSLSAFPVSGIFRGQLASISDFFLSLFFVTLGATLLQPLTLPDVLWAALLALAVILITPALVYPLARRAGLTARSALESGLLLAQTSEFSIIVGIIGLQQGHLDNRTLSIIALTTVITMILTPFIARDGMTIRLMHWLARWNRQSERVEMQDHVILLGCGAHGLDLLEWLLAHDQKVVVIDDDGGVVKRVEALGAQAIQGDAARSQVLEQAGADRARVIISTLRRVSDNERLLDRARETRVLFSVFEPSEAKRLSKAGGLPILESHVAAEELMVWFEERFAS